MITGIFLIYSLFCFAQVKSELPFEEGSRICFVGNSITHSGEFHHNLLLFHITRFPYHPVLFYNCGISGDVTGGVLQRMNDDILVHRPTHAVIMLGMNDVKRSLYATKPTSDADTIRSRETAINTYKTNLEKIVEIFLSRNIRVILQKPSYYDQTVGVSAPNNLGVNDALKICTDFIDELSLKYKLSTVDYWTIMTGIAKEKQKTDPAFSLNRPDRVHPVSAGHLVMSYQFLKSAGAPRYVSKMIIEKNRQKSTGKSQFCKIKSVSFHNNGVSFVVQENALPFPVSQSRDDGLELVPFMNELNVELLQVNDLASGKYQLTIDNRKIGVFSDVQFREGINLAEYNNTPQYCQAVNVKEKLTELWYMESSLRRIKFIEHDQYFKKYSDKENLALLNPYLDSVFTVEYKNRYYNSQLEKYVSDKPLHKEYERASDNMRQKVYSLAQPQDHSFKIIRQKQAP
jgi:endoglucanase